MCTKTKPRDSKVGNDSMLTLFQAAFGIPIAFSASVEGSATEMKPSVPVPEDKAVSLKA